MIAFVVSELLLTKKLNPRLWALSALGLLYISVSWGLMMRLWGNFNGTVPDSFAWMLPLLLIASIWINDTMAYMVGSFIGKTPFSPISPKKNLGRHHWRSHSYSIDRVFDWILCTSFSHQSLITDFVYSRHCRHCRRSV
jgi:hypothetical protein